MQLSKVRCTMLKNEQINSLSLQRVRWQLSEISCGSHGGRHLWGRSRILISGKLWPICYSDRPAWYSVRYCDGMIVKIVWGVRTRLWMSKVQKSLGRQFKNSVVNDNASSARPGRNNGWQFNNTESKFRYLEIVRTVLFRGELDR